MDTKIKLLERRVEILEEMVTKSLEELKQINKAIEWLKAHKMSSGFVPRSERIM